jgi:hypothetical protein
MMHSSFASALLAASPAADRAGRMGLYAFLVGRWEMDGIIHSGTDRYEARGEIHAAWVLEGRAIQDVWILPGAFYGSTLRVYDPTLDAWHIFWSDPTKQYFTRQLGRAHGNDIVQEGTNPDGDPLRWKFTRRTHESFHWIGERQTSANGWVTEAEFLARKLK